MSTHSIDNQTSVELNKFKVFFVNFEYFADGVFDSLDEAVEYAKSKCFEVTFYCKNTLRGSWSPVGGLKVEYF
jgi:hypothetical protein